MKIISITGTKGKTTVTRAISHVINKNGVNVLRVDTDGYYINEKQKGDLIESKEIFSLVPTVCPGKYLITMKKYFPNFIAILETALGSSSGPGLGYGLHQIGIFTNVLEDHLGASPRLKKRIDLARAKKFIFERIDVKGFLVFNADDAYVCAMLKNIPPHRKPILLPAGLYFRHFDVKEHLKKGGQCITEDNGWITIKSHNRKKGVLRIRDISWTFDGQFLPSIYNLMFIAGGLFANNNGKIKKNEIALLKKYKLSEFGGRLTMLENDKGVKILIDYAHEKYSLSYIADLAKKIKKDKKAKIIGVVRLAPDRTNKMIFETGAYIANKFDDLYVFDKIDGISKKRYVGRKSNIIRETGEVSKILYDGIKSAKKGGKVKRVIIEEDNIKEVSKIVKRGDVVIVICGDDHERSIGYVKKYFKAYFV